MSKIRILICTLLVLASVYGVQSSKEIQAEEPIGKGETPGLRRPLPDRIGKLLMAVGVNIDDSKVSGSTGTYRQLQVRWRAYVDAPAFVEPRKDNYRANREFSLVDSRTLKGTLSQPRVPQFSSEDLFVVGVDADNRLKAWSLVPDPRLLRAEQPGPTGEITGKIVHSSAPLFLINLPDDQEIVEVRFYQPQSTKAGIELIQLGMVRF